MSSSLSDEKDSITEVAEESFVRERPLEIERGAVLAGRYQVEEIIGKGGSGVVLRVFDRTVQSVVALKILKAELARDSKWEKRFSRELRLGRPIQHPNVCRIFDIGEADGHRFLTMELATGGSLRDELKRRPALERPIDERMADARAAIEGLAAIHRAAVVHRDFKPDNLLRMDDGRLVISDFGLATDAANAPGVTVMIGTPHYMAPEVLSGEPATARSDVWALGVVLHEIFFGRRPERKASSFDGSGKGPVRPASHAERAMLELCENCLQESPLSRPADAAQVAQKFRGIGVKPRPRDSLRAPVSVLVFAGLGLAVVSLFRARGDKTRASSEGDKTSVVETGTPVQWEGSADVLARIDGHVHCFSLLDDRTARIVWGSPRRAEDVDVATGFRRPSDLASEAFQTGCPEADPSDHAVLFVGRTSDGGTEIRLSETPDGRQSRSITSGTEPVWVGREDFVYSVDGSHAAVYSLPTASFTLLDGPDIRGNYAIVDKAVTRTGDRIALLTLDDHMTSAVSVYEGPGFRRRFTIPLPGGTRPQFARDGTGILLSMRSRSARAELAELDPAARRLRALAVFGTDDIIKAVESDEGTMIAMSRRISSDAWLVQNGHRSRLTADGRTFSASRSPSGDLLVSRLEDDGRYTIWNDRRSVELTDGPGDVQPAFSPDGRSWVYSDYARKRIMLCSQSDSPGSCRILREDNRLPSRPTFSPDGGRVAYVTQLGTPKAVVVSIASSTPDVSWDTHHQCPLVWSSSDRVWSFELAQGKYVWFERSAYSGRRTGQRFEMSRAGSLSPGDTHCWPATGEVPFPLPEVQIEADEVSQLLRAARVSSP
jgi:hypothetical protein